MTGAASFAQPNQADLKVPDRDLNEPFLENYHHIKLGVRSLVRRPHTDVKIHHEHDGCVGNRIRERSPPTIDCIMK